MRQRWSPYWTLIATGLAVAGTVLKVRQWYFARPLWLDEEMVLLNIRDRSFAELMSPLWLDQAAPIGWLWLQRVAIVTLGTQERVVRALPVLCGIGTIWTAWWLARRAFTPIAGLIFLALCAISPWVTGYALEVKPYATDVFAALLLMAVAIWAAEHEERPLSLRRTAIWWVVAAVAQWFSFGATLVMPACALVLTIAAWRRAGTRVAALVACQGVVWLVCFGAHYVLTLREASNDPFLHSFWAPGFPAADGGVAAAASWIADRAQSIAWNPGGTERWALFWLAAAYGGIALTVKHPAAGVLLLLVPLSGVLFAVARVVPLNDRIALWICPAVYAAVAVAAGDVFERAFERRTWRAAPVLALAAMLSVAALVVSYDIVTRGRDYLVIRGGGNHGFDDARSVGLLARRREAGDAWLAFHLSLPAVWWYGGIPIAGRGQESRVPGDPAGRVFEIVHQYYGGPDCPPKEPLRDLQETLKGVSRVLVYLGFASDIPEGAQELTLDRLDRIGKRVAYRGYDKSIAAIYDLRQPPDVPAGSEVTAVGRRVGRPDGLDGCVAIYPAVRW